jgi:hypothetical protein
VVKTRGAGRTHCLLAIVICDFDLCLRAGIAIESGEGGIIGGGGWFYCRGVTVGGEGDWFEVEGRTVGKVGEGMELIYF